MATPIFKPLAEHVSSTRHFPTVLIYGPLGTGKTAFLTQAGKDSIYMDFDRGCKTGNTLEDKYTADRKQILVADFLEDALEVPTSYMRAYDYIQQLARDCKKDPKKIPPVIILDSFTGFFKAAMAYILHLQNKVGKQPTIQSWGMVFSECERFLMKFKSIPCPKLIGAHDMILEMDDGNVKTPFGCNGKTFPTTVAALMDDVFYCQISGKGKNAKYMLTAQPSAAISCRTRTNAFKTFDMDDGFWEFLRQLGYTKA